MFKLVIYFLLAAIVSGYRGKHFWHSPFSNFSPHLGPYRLCTYKNADFAKCVHTVDVAHNNSIPLSLECIQGVSRIDCIRSVRDGSTDITILTGHGYREARMAGLRPVVFAREDDSSLSIVVASKNLTLVDLQEATIYYDHSVHRQFHAAVLFNLKRGYSICSFTNINIGPYIRIEDSAAYQPNDEEILICPNRFPGEFKDYSRCNFEASLQRAIFMQSTVSKSKIRQIYKIFQIILQHFGRQSHDQTEFTFNFFDTFLGEDNVIFKKNTIGFDLRPTYRNGVNEKVFNYLHCNDYDQGHNPKSLE
ncbi:transferrin-like [Haematobia irritans]|uniref:transferrin-like n=1 Tax=Haematobia irritans TaxID=7368 RepID=UPI003F4FD0C7